VQKHFFWEVWWFLSILNPYLLHVRFCSDFRLELLEGVSHWVQQVFFFSFLFHYDILSLLANSFLGPSDFSSKIPSIFLPYVLLFWVVIKKKRQYFFNAYHSLVLPCFWIFSADIVCFFLSLKLFSMRPKGGLVHSFFFVASCSISVSNTMV